MDRLFVAPTFIAAATEAAAIRAGLYGESGHRVLITTTNSAMPEITGRLDRTPGFEPIGEAFDQVISLNELIWPKHPRRWGAPEDEAERVRTTVLRETGLQPGTGLTLQSLGVKPSSRLVQVFHDSPIDVISDGLMSYGPVRRLPAPDVLARLERLLYLDLVPGLKPLLFAGTGIDPVIVPTEAYVALMDEYAARHPENAHVVGLADESTAMVVGQYLAALGLMTGDEEDALYREMVEAAALLGYRKILFKPHPSAPPQHTEAVIGTAQAMGVDVSVSLLPVPVEAIYSAARPGLVIGGFSTAVSTAAELYGIETLSVGTSFLGRALPDFPNSNRIPVALTAATTRRIERRGDTVEILPPLPVPVQELADALGATMQPAQLPDRYPAARVFAGRALADPELRDYFHGYQPAPDDTPLRRVAKAGYHGALAVYRGLRKPLRPLRRLARRTWRRARFTWYAARVEIPAPIGRADDPPALERG